MAATGYTPIQLYYSTTAAAVPTAGNLASGELAINITDGKLYFKNNSGTVTLLAGSGGAIAPLTANGVVYVNSSSQATSGSALVFNGTNLGVGVTPSAWNTTTARAIQIGNVSSLSNYNNGIAASTAAILSQNSYYPTDGSPEQYLISGTGANKFVMVNGEARWHTAGSGTAGNNITFTQPMTLNASGLLGLGGSSPTSRLYVVSSVASNTGGFVANFSTDSADTARMGIYAYGSTYSGGTNFGLGANSVNIQTPAGFGIASGGTSPIVFGTNSTTEWARFTTPGNFGLGAPASTNWNSPYRAIDIGINNIYASLWGSSNGDGGASTYGQSGLGQNLNGGDFFTGAGYASYYGQSGGRHSWWTSSAAGTAGGAITFVRAMMLTENRNLLIGTTSVRNNERLIVDSNGTGGSTSYNSAFTYSGNTNTAYCSSTWSHGEAGTATGYIGVGGSAAGNVSFANNFVVGTQTANALVFNTGDAEKARISAAGNFGVGNTNPAVKLDVIGGVLYEGNFYLTSQFRNAATSAEKGILLGYNNSDTSSILASGYAGGVGALAFWTQNGVEWGERARLTAAGNFGIGVTPTAKFQVAGSASNGGAMIKYDVTSANSTFNWVSTAFASNMTTGNLIHFIGQAGSLNNAAYFGFQYNGSTSANNLATIGLFGNDNLLNVNAEGNVSLKSATTSAIGIGITFPATQSASSNANCLDDYEEGTWTPVLTASVSAPTVTYSNLQGTYRKIGSLCWISWGMRVGTISGGSGEIQIEGLPFTSSSPGSYAEPMVVMGSGVWTTAVLAGQAYAFVWNSSNFMRTRRNSNADATIDILEVQAGTYMLGQLCYVVA
jgi:hypothetical protein